MEIQTYNLLNVGVGGQGVIRAIQILSWAALHEGFKVRTAETHGMAQRGGSVASYLRFGTQIEGPLIPRGEANVILAFEASEAVRNFNYAGPQTHFIINEKLIIPPMIHQQGLEYPTISQIRKFLSDVSKNINFIPADDLALKAGNQRAMNVVMLGVLVGINQIPIKKETIFNSIMNFIPKKTTEINRNAFELGIEKGLTIRGGKK
ncbi:MAG: indolepyruvate ferredoxin oxidoreductase subunit beta [Promethearchaeota archaeon]|nr:MAG: indolepyruvate ferredoxin oxidoreductase subunit beta [Candidatus Lokiarchaeota archaeon]